MVGTVYLYHAASISRDVMAIVLYAVIRSASPGVCLRGRSLPVRQLGAMAMSVAVCMHMVPKVQT